MKGYYEQLAYHTNEGWAHTQKLRQPPVLGFYRGGERSVRLVLGGFIYFEHCLRGVWMIVGRARLLDPERHLYWGWAEVWADWQEAAGAPSAAKLEMQGTRQLGWVPGQPIEVLGLSEASWLCCARSVHLQ